MSVEFKIGDEVETVETFNQSMTRVNCGKVERVTKTQIVMRNEHGNIQKFSRLKLFRDKLPKQIGFAYPFSTSVLRHKSTREFQGDDLDWQAYWVAVDSVRIGRVRRRRRMWKAYRIKSDGKWTLLAGDFATRDAAADAIQA